MRYYRRVCKNTKRRQIGEKSKKTKRAPRLGGTVGRTSRSRHRVDEINPRTRPVRARIQSPRTPRGRTRRFVTDPKRTAVSSSRAPPRRYAVGAGISVSYGTPRPRGNNTFYRSGPPLPARAHTLVGITCAHPQTNDNRIGPIRRLMTAS